MAGHHTGDWWRIVLIGPVLPSHAQSGVPGFGASCVKPLCQWLGPCFAVRRHRPRYTRHGTGRGESGSAALAAN